MVSVIQLRTVDHPEAGGRQAVAGDRGYMLVFPLEGGTSLEVMVGAETMMRFQDFLGRQILDTNPAPLAWRETVSGAEWRAGDWLIRRQEGSRCQVFYLWKGDQLQHGPCLSVNELQLWVEHAGR